MTGTLSSPRPSEPAAPAYRTKLIEAAHPLEAINKGSAREKSIRHGHPSTLHLCWTRRLLAACRAVLQTRAAFADVSEEEFNLEVDKALVEVRREVGAERETAEGTGRASG